MSALRATGYVAVTLVLVAIAFALGLRWQSPPQQQPASAAPSSPTHPEGVVVVAKQAQAQSGLETAAVKPFVLHRKTDAYAVALDVRPLLSARRQIATAQAEVHGAQSAERASRAEYERMHALFADERNVSEKAMQAAQAAWRADQGKLQAATAALRETEAAAVQQFGPALVGPSGDGHGAVAQQRPPQGGLVQVMLAPSVAAAAPSRVTLSAPGYPRSVARRIGPSAQVDASTAGRAFLYRSEFAYPSGLRLQAELPAATKPLRGFLVPEQAVVWYGNEAWVFVQADADRFVRRALAEPQAAEDGAVFTTTSFGPQERVVTRGAQLLQSEALRPKTPATSGCADPECDD